MKPDGGMPARQRGVALLTVMFIMMLLTTLVVYLVEDDQLAVRRVSNQQESEQGFHLAVYSEQWVRKLLEADVRDNDTDQGGENWQTQKPALDDGVDGELDTQVVDLQGRFNLNNLAGVDDENLFWYLAFQRLLVDLQLDPGLADAVKDWVDGDINPSGHDGAEDDVYTRKEPPYQTPNRLMADVGELAWIHGMNAEAIRVLRPHVTALPGTDVKINVNTASSRVLGVLTSDLTAGVVESRLRDREADPYESVRDFQAEVLIGVEDEVGDHLSITSEYFEVRSQVELGRYATVLYSVIERPAETQQARVIQRRRGIS